MTVSPTGAVHEVGLEDLFFSTTDRRGVIDEANEVFVRLARRPRHELLGSPHNIIRHPSMPGGIFRVLWSEMIRGRATCGYVVNLGGDGSAYWTMATLLPTDDGYLSVRSRPCCTDLVGLAAEVYELVRQQEAQARESGHGSAAAARIGEELLLKELADRGYPSYQSFIQVALPSELETRVMLSGGLPERPAATGPARTMLASVREIEARVRTLALDLGGMKDRADLLRRHVATAQASLSAMDEALQQARRTVEGFGDQVPLLAKAGGPLHDRCQSVVTSLRETGERIQGLADNRAALRFSVAMAQMQAEMVGRFVIAVIDGIDDASSDAAVRGLVQALEAGLRDVGRDLDRNLEASAAVHAQLKDTNSALRVTRMAMGKWRKLIEQYDLHEEMAAHMPALDAALQRAGQEIGALTKAVDGFADSAAGFDTGAVDTELKQILVMQDQLGAPETPRPAHRRSTAGRG